MSAMMAFRFAGVLAGSHFGGWPPGRPLRRCGFLNFLPGFRDDGRTMIYLAFSVPSAAFDCRSMIPLAASARIWARISPRYSLGGCRGGRGTCAGSTRTVALVLILGVRLPRPGGAGRVAEPPEKHQEPL